MSLNPGRARRLTLLGAATAIGGGLSAAALAQNLNSPPQSNPSPPSQSAAPTATGAGPNSPQGDPVVAKVNGQPIHLSDLNQAAQSLPEQLRSIPPQTLFPMLLDQQIDRKALVSEARKSGLDKDPAVQHQLEMAEDATLQNALLSRQVGPTVSDEALRARYEHDMAGKPGEEEVHAAHILVPTEEEAKKIIAELKKGGDFAALAKQYSKDPGAAQGGDLGWFKKDEMVPAFSAAAFSLKPGEVSDKPIKTEFGWHVIKVEDKRQAAPPTFEQARDSLRQKMIQEGVQKAVQQARAEVTVEKFNVDGSPAASAKAGGNATPAPPPTAGASPPPVVAPAPAPDKK